ncbi:hypothetical protein ACHAXT_010635 [Thalassiosira profunda]
MPRRTTSRLLRLALAALALLAATAAAADAAASGDDDAAAASSGDSQTAQAANNADAAKQRGAPNKVPLANPLLDENSVVLITGAAGFLGSELALALRRTYSVRQLLLVDDLGIVSENESSYVPPPPDKAGKPTRPIYEKFTEQELGAFEIKRQRAFRIFHELTAPSYLEPEEEGTEGWGEVGGVGGRSGGAESVRFYRADMRPSIPEFFDFGEVPLLEGIFQSHPDITHVVHLADVPKSEQNQAIPRRKDSVKAGRFEGLLEEFRLVLERAAEDGNGNVRVPQLVYASTHDVYDQIPAAERNAKATRDRPNPPPFREDKPITTPSSLHGTAKLIDEVLASAYHSTHGIYSVGLRFFPVYGPWGSPGTEVFDLAERVAALSEGGVAEGGNAAYEHDVKDYVYIDDAVDAILSAMQYRPPGEEPPPVVFNVGTGKGTTLSELREAMASHFPKLGRATRTDNPAHTDRVATQSIADPSRSAALLGFQAQVPLSEGVARTLAWHRDRSLPYGRDASAPESLARASTDRAISASLDAAKGEECSPLDRECARGAPVFPCASECRRPEKCTPSAWDEVAARSAKVTEGCETVLYTILLDEHAEQIPSAVATATGEASYVGVGLPDDSANEAQAQCNIAFVSESSPLVKRLRAEGEEYPDEGSEGNGNGNGNGEPLLRHGFWTILPVKTSDPPLWTHAFDGTHSLEYLPKLSPGRFFAPSVKYAAYSCPFIVVEDLPALLKMVEEGPPLMDGSTALFLAEARPSNRAVTWQRPVRNDSVQQGAYNMVRAALRRDVLGGGLEPSLDSSFVVHLLREEDARLFRCDAYGEAAQWGARGDGKALEFIVSLHDLWSQAVSHWSGQPAWWSAEGGSNGGAGNAEVDGSVEGDDAKEEAAEGEEGDERRRLTDASGEMERTGKWMGILSSAETQLFTHLIPPEGLGITHLEDRDYSR